MAVRLVRVWLGKDLVDGMEQMGAQRIHATGAPLSQLNEVIDEDVGVADGPLQHTVGLGGLDGRGFVRLPFVEPAETG
jgi:hypothetical protein